MGFEVAQARRVGDTGATDDQSELRMASEDRLARWLRLDLQDFVKNIEETYQHRRGAGGVLPDHVKHGIAQACIIGNLPVQHYAAIPEDDITGQMTWHHLGQRGAKVF